MGASSRLLSVVAAGMLCASLVTGHAIASDRANGLQGSIAKWGPWLELGGYASTEASRGEAAIFSPLWQSANSLFFADLRGKIFEQSISEGNFALGFRHMLPSGWNFGLWGGYDLRRSSSGNLFRQMAGGFELLSADFDLRANAYLPLDREKTISVTAFGGGVTSVDLVGNQLVLTSGGGGSQIVRELGLWGVDAEVGWRVPLGYLGLEEQGKPHHELRVYAGAFHFDHADLSKAITGAKARAEWHIHELFPQLPGSRLTFEAEIRNDYLRKTAYEVGARLRIPLGTEPQQRRVLALNAQERRMSEGLERDTDIVTQSSTKTTGSGGAQTQEAVEDALTGTDFDSVVILTDEDDGRDAFDDGNRLIILDTNLSGSWSMLDNQTLMGAGSSIEVRGLDTGTVATFTAPGTVRPTLEGTISMANHTHINGLDVRPAVMGGGASGVWIDNQTNVAITGLSIVGDGTNASTNGYYTHVTGVNIAGPATNVRIFDTTFSQLGGSAIDVRGGAELTLDNVTISDSGFGILLGSNTTFVMNNSQFQGHFDATGLDLYSPNLNMSGAGNSSTATYGRAFCDVYNENYQGPIGFTNPVMTVPDVCELRLP